MRACYSCSPYRLARGCFTTFDWLLDGRTYDKLDVTSGKLDALGDLHSTLREILEQVRILLKSAGVWLDCRKQACSVTFVYDSPIWLQYIPRSRPVTTGPPATPVRTMPPPACLDRRRALPPRLREAAELKFLPTKCTFLLILTLLNPPASLIADRLAISVDDFSSAYQNTLYLVCSLY